MNISFILWLTSDSSYIIINNCDNAQIGVLQHEADKYYTKIMVDYLLIQI